jgi:AraC-like DNA-binding protein
LAAEERHYSPAEIAEIWNLSEDAVRRLFEKEQGVLVLENHKPGKRRYRTFRIPESVAQRVHRKLSLSQY